MNAPLNVFILNTPHDNWEKFLIEDFKKKGIIQNAIVQKAARESKEIFLKLGTNGLDGNYKFVPIKIYNAIYERLFEFMDMYSRVSFHNSFDYNEFNIHQSLDHFNLILNYYYKVFTENKIDLFIHNNSPHVGYDFIPNLLAEELGIKALYLEQSFFPNKFFYYWKYKDYGSFETSGHTFTYPEEIKIENKFEKEIPYMKKVKSRGINLRGIRDLKNLNSELSRSFHEYQFLKDLVKSKSRGQAYYRYKLKKKYSKQLKKLSNEVDLNQPYIYFGLHMQPEKSTSSWGGKYCDQALALEHLSSILPEGWKIIVKENPKQSYFMRNPEFFKRLERIPDLKIVSTDFDTYKLIRNSKICATITGTIGWEAITGGKPVVIFGWGVWYKTLPGVYNFSTDLNLEQISLEKVDFELLQSKFNSLTEKMAPGIILNEYYPSIYKDYEVNKNSELVTKSIEAIIKSKFN